MPRAGNISLAALHRYAHWGARAGWRPRPGPDLDILLASAACNADNVRMQYTIRNVPGPLDAVLRRSAREQGKSLNEVAIEALARGAGLTERRCGQRDLSDIAKTWRHDSAFDHALAAQDTIDQELWR
jgi:hypothetical protein